MDALNPRWERAAALGLLMAAVLLWALTRTYPNYDAYFHLVWGREVLHGHLPSFEAYAAPTEHPLYVAIAGLLGLLGTHADRALVLFTSLCHVALILATYRLGRAFAGRWVGLAAAAFVGSSFAFLLYAAKAYVDLPFLAIVIYAAALEAERPRRGRDAMALLAIAGLLRPEAWVLAGLYWLWCGWRRWDLLALAAAAPLLWALVDLVVTGDPLFSLHSTSELADELNRTRGLSHVPHSFVSFLVDTARPPVALLGVAGAMIAWMKLPRERLVVPAALFAAGTIAFVGTGLAGLSILPRYLTVPAIAVCLLAGYGLLGWTALPAADAWRRPWRTTSAVTIVAGLALLAVLLPPRARKLESELRFVRQTHDQLGALLHAREVTAGRRCGPISYPTYRLVPDTRWLLDTGEHAVLARSDRDATQPARGVAIVIQPDTKAETRYGKAAGIKRGTNVAPPGFRPVARRGPYGAFGRC